MYQRQKIWIGTGMVLAIGQDDVAATLAALKPPKRQRPPALTVMGNRAALWNREERSIAVAPGIDEVSLALVADAWSRTYRSRAVTLAGSPGQVTTRNGIRIVPDNASADQRQEDAIVAFGDRAPAQALDAALSNIEQRYGPRTRYVVAMQLEYPRL